MSVDTSSEHIRDLVVEAVDAAADLIGDPAVEGRWDEPSALAAMTVGALCAHLVRAAGATIAYLDRTSADHLPDDDLLTPVTYFHAAIESPIHDQIRDVSSKESEIGHEATALKCRTLASDLRSRLAIEPEDRLVGALGGRMLSLDDFCRTRLIEVLLHVDDIATSVDLPRPETHPDGPAIVVEILQDIARHIHGDWQVVYALARKERSTGPPVYPVV